MMRAVLILMTVIAAPVAPVSPSTAEPAIAPFVIAAVGDAARPADQIANDEARKPATVLAFAGVKPGDRVADFMSGNAYFTRILSPLVGKTGHVYAFLPVEELKNCAPAETAGTRAIEHDRRYANVTVMTAAVNRFRPPEPLDVVWTALNFHDLYDSFMGPADVAAVTRSIFDALKPGGILVIIDHVAEPGSMLRDTETLHRIDPEAIRREARAAGFRLEAESPLLRNSQDGHELLVFDPAIRGRTDQVILKFRKPAGAG